MLLDNDYQKKQSIDRGAVAGPDCDLEATAQLQLAPHAAEETGNTAGLGLPRIEAWESGGKLGNQRPKRDPNHAKGAALRASSVGESRSHEASPVASVRARTRAEAVERSTVRDPSFFSQRPERPRLAKPTRTHTPRVVSVNAVALALAAFFVLCAVAGTVAANARSNDRFVQELR